jgi:amidohydrolase
LRKDDRLSVIDQIQITPELDAWLRETRRYLHMNPELSLEETNTARLVSGHLNELGTVRTFSAEVQDHIERRVGEIASGVASAMRAEVEVNYLRWYPSLSNDAALSEIVRSAAIERLGEDQVQSIEPSFGGEDFAFVSRKVPSCMFRLGVAYPARGITYSMHHPRFDLDEDALAVGVEVMAAAALRYLNS